MRPPSLSLVIGVSGASGSVYAERFLRALTRLVEGESSLIISPAALRVYRQERDSRVTAPHEYLEEALSSLAPEKRKHSLRIADYEDIGGVPASGSSGGDGMVVVPCSMKSLAGIGQGYTNNLLERAADVALKERRRLVLVPRETPYSLIHLRNMTALTEAGAIILPASPGFYQKPRTIEDLGDFIAGRILSLWGLQHDLFPAWRGDSD